MLNGRKLSLLGRWPFARIHGGDFFIEAVKLFARLRTFDEEEHENPLTVSFACCHNVHPLTQWYSASPAIVWSILLSARLAPDEAEDDCDIYQNIANRDRIPQLELCGIMAVLKYSSRLRGRFRCATPLRDISLVFLTVVAAIVIAIPGARSAQRSIKAKRLEAACNHSYLLKLLRI